MADMDTVITRDRPGEFISATLGPRGHEVSRFELMRMIATAIQDVRDGGGEEIDLDY